MVLRRKSRLVPMVGSGLAVVLAVGLALAGCSTPAGDAGGPGAPSGGTRTVTDVTGETVELPVAPERVVALDEPAALNLLAMGVTPAAFFQGWKTVVPAELIKGLGIDMHTTAGYQPTLEEVAALQPDLIVVSTSPERANDLPDYASIAPTLRALYSASLDKLAQTWGDYVGDADRAAAIERGLADFGAEIAGEQPDPALSLSALESYGGAGDVGLYFMDAGNSLHGVIASAGFDRPDLQENTNSGEHGGWAAFSPERLPDHDAGIIAIKASTQYDPKGITGLPLFTSLKGRAVPVDGDFWSGGSLFYAYWVLCDLHDFVHGDHEPGGSAAATDRWDAFMKLTER